MSEDEQLMWFWKLQNDKLKADYFKSREEPVNVETWAEGSALTKYLKYLVVELKNEFFEQRGFKMLTDKFEWSEHWYKELAEMIGTSTKTISRLFTGKLDATNHPNKLFTLDKLCQFLRYKNWDSFAYKHSEKCKHLTEIDRLIRYVAQREFWEYKHLPVIDRSQSDYSEENMPRQSLLDEWFDYLLHERLFRSFYAELGSIEVERNLTIRTRDNRSNFYLYRADVKNYKWNYVELELEVFFNLRMFSTITKKFCKNVSIYIKQEVVAHRGFYGWWYVYEPDRGPLEVMYLRGLKEIRASNLLENINARKKEWKDYAKNKLPNSVQELFTEREILELRSKW